MRKGDAPISRRKIVLIVEDDDALRDELVELLNDEGYRVLVASDGQRALAVLEQLRPHLILLDLMLPIVSGWEVLAAIGTDASLAGIPVIVLSAYADQAPRDVACILSKPVDTHTLCEAIRRHSA